MIEKGYSPVSLQDIRFNLEDPSITRSKRNIGVRIFISDLVTVLGVVGVGVGGGGRLGRSSVIGIVVVVAVTMTDITEVDLVHSLEVCGSHLVVVVVE
jgi:hypothetical protein